MVEEDISRGSDCDHPETNHKSSTRGAKPYVNNQNYLSTVYNVDDDRTITSQSNRNDHSSNGSGSQNTEQDNDNQKMGVKNAQNVLCQERHWVQHSRSWKHLGG